MSCWAALEAADRRSRPFRWATLGVDDVARVAAAAGFDCRASTGSATAGPPS